MELNIERPPQLLLPAGEAANNVIPAVEGNANGIIPIPPNTTPRKRRERGEVQGWQRGWGGRGGTSDVSFQGNNNNRAELPVRCPVQTEPGVYCDFANFVEASWCGKCGSENLYYRKPYSPKPHQFFTPPRGGHGYRGMSRGGRSWHKRN